MSLFDLQDVCIVIGSLATLDLPMVVDLIGIYVLKGPYCTLTMTNWFLQALSVIPRGSWGDVARRFTMIRWYGNQTKRFDKIVQQQVTVAKSMRVNTIACDWLNFEFQSLRLILIAAGGWWLARTIERNHERVTRGEYCS
ncbi:hypothetical protein F511_33523 [Dorcoceras hygrometricum]|uniref:Uncharacterized protein n=1 Tax=Dorcoceras hygrometricum TaxID=472368 RepID=A0A2Z7B6P7_9LAMI|nr:hypothetical protein F511_33523 [Dorcoceras hygrometricum]